MLPVLGLGGSENHVVALAAGLRERGHDAEIITVFDPGFLAVEAQKRGVPVACLESKGWGIGALVKIFRWLRSGRMDILHTYLSGFHVFAGLTAKLFLKIPAVVSSRREIASWRKFRHCLVEDLGNLFVDRVVCCSNAVREWTLANERIQPFKILTIHNGVDLDSFTPGSKRLKTRDSLGIPADAKVVGTVANFALEKGYSYLLCAIEAILRDNPRTWFLLVGSGPLLEDMKHAADNLALGRQILFPGFRRDVPALVDAMDIFVLASVSEGFPNVLLEAMAMAKSVVATEVGGIPELISSGHDGILVQPQNADILAEAINRLIKNPADSERLGKNARTKIQTNFSLTKMVDKYEELYCSLVPKQNG